MAEKRLSREELDQVGLPSIKIDDDNKTKLTKLFEHYRASGDPLPSYGVNASGDIQPNFSLLARLGKVIQGKQVFKRDYAKELLEAAITDCGLEERDKPEASSDAEIVCEAMQDNINTVRREMSGVDDKLQEALTKIRSLEADLDDRDEQILTLTSQVQALEAALGREQQRTSRLDKHERHNLRRVR